MLSLTVAPKIYMRYCIHQPRANPNIFLRIHPTQTPGWLNWVLTLVLLDSGYVQEFSAYHPRR